MTTARMTEIGQLIHTQDNRATDTPIFIVEEQRRTYGFDPDYTEDHVAWIDMANDHVEATPEEHTKLEAQWGEDGIEPDGWTRTAYQDAWHFVTACFTEQGCKDYIAANGHNHRGALRVYAAGSWRNEEWRAVAKFLAELAELATAGGGQ